jgi:hypothetical protein
MLNRACADPTFICCEYKRIAGDIEPRQDLDSQPVTSSDFRWKFKKSAEFSNFQQMFYFSNGRLGFPAGKFIFQEIF